MGFIGDMLGGDSDAASDASLKASYAQVDFQREALNYLKEQDAVPSRFKGDALRTIGGVMGLPGGVGTQQGVIDQALASPLYANLMSGKKAGEEAILRNVSATGGLRSGDVQSNLYDYNAQLQNNALLQSYNQQMQGLQGLAGLQTNQNQIAQQTNAIGSTYAQGIAASGQAQQQGQQNMMNNLLGIGTIAAMFSDRRLKKNIKLIGFVKGWRIYSWDWNIVAQKMGLTGSTIGTMAEEVYAIDPTSVFIKDMFMMVNYTKIGLLGGVA